MDEDAQKTFFQEYGFVEQKVINYARFMSLHESIILLPFCFEQDEKLLQNWAVLAVKQGIKCLRA